MTGAARAALLEYAVETYGRESQRDMMIEEMAELTKALLKERRTAPIPVSELKEAVRNIREEMADVQIMLDQLRIIYGDTTEIEDAKLERLAGRLEFYIMAGPEPSIKEMVDAGYDVGDHCRQCIDNYGTPCCKDEESECGLFDDNRQGFIEYTEARGAKGGAHDE